ncbi:beta subunit of N-acylethanolamine-hydrolyzing acid amidase domain containing protein [Hyaloscypha variabilis]
MAPRAPVRPDPIPTYRIDLSLPPEQRYLQLATDFGPKMRAITPLFDEVLSSLIPWPRLRHWIEFLASIFLRRVYSPEETRELHGIAKASGVALYILIALNVLLDSLLGCTSGGVMTELDKKGGRRAEGKAEARMLHFRTLDWGMDPLRGVLVQLEFVRSGSRDPEEVLARTVTYAGFVGVLTGVREGLSLSLNFRPNHHCSTFKLRLHQLLVIFGFRPAIASYLRNAIFSHIEGSSQVALGDLTAAMAQPKTAPCYLVLCDGERTIVIEKDLIGAKIRESKEFIVHTNHDTKSEDPAVPAQSEKSTILGLEVFLEESEERRECVQKKWDALVKRLEKKENEAWMSSGVVEVKPPMVREERLREWVRAYPVMNESTHFGCIMDAKTGTIRFLERGSEDAR